MKIIRDGKPMEIAVQLGQFPSKQERAAVGKENQPGSSLEGVSVENLTADAAQELKLPPQTKGVVVDEVSPASRAAEAGLKAGDVIEEVNHQPVGSVNEFNHAIGTSQKDGPVLLLVDRQGNTIFLAV
jgi:serine protease Do